MNTGRYDFAKISLVTFFLGKKVTVNTYPRSTPSFWHSMNSLEVSLALPFVTFFVPKDIRE